MTVGHQNLCDHAEDERALYSLWNDDLKKTMRKRQYCELGGGILLAAGIFGFDSFSKSVTPFLIFFGVMLLYSGLKFMIDESNVNYLMHAWDLRDTIKGFRREQVYRNARELREAEEHFRNS